MAREIDQHEHQIADLLLDMRRIARCDRIGHLARFLLDLGENRVNVVPVEPDGACGFLQFQRARQRRPTGLDLRQNGGGKGASLQALFLRLDLAPQGADLVRRQIARIPEHMGMAPDQLGGDGLHHAAEIERALFLRHLRMEHDLQQQIAQFLAQVAEIAPCDRISDLIGFFDRIGRDGREILFQIPRAAGDRRAQGGHDLEEAGNVARSFHRAFLARRRAKEKARAEQRGPLS